MAGEALPQEFDSTSHSDRASARSSWRSQRGGTVL